MTVRDRPSDQQCYEFSNRCQQAQTIVDGISAKIEKNPEVFSRFGKHAQIMLSMPAYIQQVIFGLEFAYSSGQGNGDIDLPWMEIDDFLELGSQECLNIINEVIFPILNVKVYDQGGFPDRLWFEFDPLNSGMEIDNSTHKKESDLALINKENSKVVRQHLSDLSRSQSIAELIKDKEVDFEKYLSLLDKCDYYKIPKGFLGWGKLRKILSTYLFLYTDRSRYLEDWHGQIANFGAALWYIQSAPIYLMGNELLQSFAQTNISSKKELIASIKLPLPTFVLLFPENAILTYKQSAVDHVVIHVSDPASMANSCGQKNGIEVSIKGWQDPSDLVIVWSCIDTGSNAWCSTMSINNDGKLANAELVCMENESEDIKITEKIDNLVLQTILCLCFKSELITDVEASEIRESGKGFAVKSKSNQPHYLTPRWLGKNYQHQTTKGDRSDREYHVSGWWRKGFWRNQPYGTRANPSYRPTWIEPTWCQPGE